VTTTNLKQVLPKPYITIKKFQTTNQKLLLQITRDLQMKLKKKCSQNHSSQLKNNNNESRALGRNKILKP
jgi:hypothetical protein